MKQELHCSLCKHTLGSKYFFQNIRTVRWSFTGAFYSLFFLDIRFNCQRKQTGPGNWHWEYFLYFKSCFLTTTNTTTTSVTTRRDTRQDGSIKSRKTVKVRVNTLHEEMLSVTFRTPVWGGVFLLSVLLWRNVQLQ